MSEWLPYIQLALSVLILPLFKLLWDLRNQVTQINGKVQAHEQRLDAVNDEMKGVRQRLYNLGDRISEPARER